MAPEIRNVNEVITKNSDFLLPTYFTALQFVVKKYSGTWLSIFLEAGRPELSQGLSKKSGYFNTFTLETLLYFN